MSVQRMRIVKRIVIAGLVASMLHFADNTFAITQYPEPAWITPQGVAASWCLVLACAVAVLARKRADRAFYGIAAIYALLLTGGLLHYAFGAPMHMAWRTHATVLAEAFVGIALAAALLLRGRAQAGV